MVGPFAKGLSESFKNICGKVGTQVHFKGDNTIRNLIMTPKGKDNVTQKSGVIYSYKCDRLECDEEYIGESARTFEEGLKEHISTPSPIYVHASA